MYILLKVVVVAEDVVATARARLVNLDFRRTIKVKAARKTLTAVDLKLG